MPGAFDVNAGAWSSDVPIYTDSWKRALHRHPPNNFSVKVLPPEKHGSSHSYGFRVTAIKDDNASIATRTSISGTSIASVNEYDIWRKWEDCLLFQDALENEYARAAREKRNRLAAGKGVKKNGVYIHSDQAASWESLPFGPDPNDIARDIHKHVPQLTKKGTLFRASQETVDRRYQDLLNMMEALFEDDLPTLIKELKDTSTFTDFFGIWKRDVELVKKAAAAAKKSVTPRPRTSMSASMFASFPVSPASLSSMTVVSSSKGKGTVKSKGSSRTFIHSDCSSSDDVAERPRSGRVSDRKQEHSARPRCSSSDSRSSSSLPPTPVTAPPQLPFTSHQPIVASHDAPVRFDHNPHALTSERCASMLESLPEDRELSSSPKSDSGAFRSARRASSTANRVNRSTRIYVPSQSFESPSEPTSRSFSHYSRASIQSTDALPTSYLDELGVDYCLSSPTPEPRCRPRASVSSLASLVTNASVDAVIPRSERPSRSYARSAQRQRYEPWSEDESEDQEDILDAYFCDLIRPRAPTPDGFPETPTLDEAAYRFSQAQNSSTLSVSSYTRYSDRRSSFATSVSSGSTSSTGNPMMLSIKAMHEDNIIMLRLPRYTTYDDLRRKIYDKFRQTDRCTICDTFAIALLEGSPDGTAAEQRPRADSLSSLGSAQVKRAALHFISSQDEWDDVVATHPVKMLLRIIGSRE